MSRNLRNQAIQDGSWLTNTLCASLSGELGGGAQKGVNKALNHHAHNLLKRPVKSRGRDQVLLVTNNPRTEELEEEVSSGYMAQLWVQTLRMGRSWP